MSLARIYTKVGIVGAGRAGDALAQMLQKSGVEVAFRTVRTRRSKDNELVFDSASRETHEELKKVLCSFCDGERTLLILSPTDDALSQVVDIVSALRASWSGVDVVHLSGGTELKVLSPFVKRGAETGVLHPCYPITKGTGTKVTGGIPQGVVYTIETGGESPLDIAARLGAAVKSFGGMALSVTGVDRARYHAGCVLSAGHVVALLESATRSLNASGIPNKSSREIVLSIANGVFDNLSQSGSDFAGAMTGPFVRKDEAVIKKHRQALKGVGVNILEIYDLLGRRIREIIG